MEESCRRHSSGPPRWGPPAWRSPVSASARGRSAAAAGSSAGGRSTTRSRSPRSTGRSSSGSTGSTPPRSTASAARSRSSAARCEACASGPYVFTKCSLLDDGTGPRPAQSQARLDPARGRGQPAAARRRGDRPVPDPLADPRAGHRGGLGGDGRAEGARPGPAHRRVQLQRRPAAPHRLDRADRDAPAAVLAGRPWRRGGDPAVRASARGSASSSTPRWAPAC